MNERQATTQSRLSKGENLGQNSLNRRGFNDEDDTTDEAPSEMNSEVESENLDDGKKMSKGVFGIMLVVALVLDVIALVPVIGWGISTIILILIYLKLGVKFHMKNVLKFGSCDLVKLVPGSSLIPAFVLSVILNLGPMIEDLENSIPGGEAVVHSVQKALSSTKR